MLRIVNFWNELHGFSIIDYYNNHAHHILLFVIRIGSTNRYHIENLSRVTFSV